MADTKKLARVVAVPHQDGARLTVETVDGATFDIAASYDQLEDLADTLDDILCANDDALEVKDGESAPA
jgi:hypothetical protein